MTEILRGIVNVGLFASSLVGSTDTPDHQATLSAQAPQRQCRVEQNVVFCDTFQIRTVDGRDNTIDVLPYVDEVPSLGDWAQALKTAWPDAREFLRERGCIIQREHRYTWVIRNRMELSNMSDCLPFLVTYSS